MMNKLQKGIWLALGTAVISGGANFVNKFAMNTVSKNPYQYTTLKNVVVALILSAVILSPVVWRQLIKLQKCDWLKLIAIAVIGGSFPFLLFFKGLSMTSPVNASFIHKTLFIWVALMAVPVLKEKVGRLQILALGLLFVGVIVFSGAGFLQGGHAEFLILIATILWAIENVIAKVALRRVDSIVLAWARMFLGSIILLGFLAATGNMSGLFAIQSSQVGWILLVGMFLTGYVVTWYSALKWAPATVVTSFLVLAAPITAGLNAVFVTHKYSWEQVSGGFIILVAIIIVSRITKLSVGVLSPTDNTGVLVKNTNRQQGE